MRGAQPVLCLITDRRRFGSTWPRALVSQVAAAAEAGVDLVQIREPDLDGGPLAALVAECLHAVRRTRTRVVVNDRIDVALAVGAHGVHLRGSSPESARVRAICPRPFLIGGSVHAVSDLTRASGSLDYLIFGTVFASGSKLGREPAGTAGLARVAMATSLPVLAVGGVTADNVASLRHAGAAGAAGIGCFTDDPAGEVRRIRSAWPVVD